MFPIGQFLRVRDWGIQIPIFLGSAAVCALALEGTPRGYWTCALVVSLLQILLLVAAYTVNDFFDRHDDLAKLGAPVPPGLALKKLLVAGGCLVSGILLGHGFLSERPALAVLWATAAGSVAYSAPGVRLKERGLWGILTAASLQRIPAFLMLALSFSLPPIPVVVITGWLFGVGLAFIIEHQIQDLDADRLAGVETFMGSISQERLGDVRTWTYRALRASPMLAGMGLMVGLRTPGALLASGFMVGGNQVLIRVLSEHYAKNDSVVARPIPSEARG